MPNFWAPSPSQYDFLLFTHIPLEKSKNILFSILVLQNEKGKWLLQENNITIQRHDRRYSQRNKMLKIIPTIMSKLSNFIKSIRTFTQGAIEGNYH